MRKVQSSPYGVSHLPHGMADSIETDSETGSFSDESINSVLGYQSYLSNINYLADHVDNDPMTRGLGASNGSGPYSYDINSPIGSAASKVGSREPGIHEYLTDFDSSTKEFTDGSKSFPEFSNLLGYILKSEFRKIMYADMFYHAVDVRREEHRNVVLRVSPTYSNISKIYGIFNEWYILSGLNAINGHHPLWSNDMLQNEYLPKLIEGKAEGPRFDPLRSDIKTPVTLPKGIDGVLYPLDAFCLPYYKDGKNIPSNNRMVLVYENYDYATLKVAQKDSYLSYFQDLDDYKVPLFQLSRFAQLSGKPRMSSAGLKEYFPDLGPFSLASSNTVKTPPLSASLNPTQLTTASLSALTTDFSNMETSGLPPKSKSRFFDELNHQVRQYSKPIVCIIELLSDFIKILKTLKTVHELGIVHNGLTTSNILKSTSKSGVHKNKIKLSGWDFYCSIQPEDCSNGYRKSHLRQVPDLLPYLSPESTGEANIPVDYRSDFYSIGIIMYELIVGCLPFQSDKPTTLLRMQILQKPIAPILLASNWVSEELSDIILKLLEKQPDDRYFDCGTIINDLIQVKSNYIDHVANSSLQTYEFWCNHPYYREYFVKDELLGGKDKSIGLPTMFFFPKTVYGRTAEFSSIFKTYESLSTGTNMIVLSGPYDYDKTAIMNELKLSPLSKSEFYFSWTFNNTSSNPSTYQCLIHGIRLIFQQVLATSPAQVTRWRELIVLKINVDLSIMFHKVPELKLILGTKYSNIYESRRQRQTNETNSSVSEQNDYFSTPHDNMVHDNTGEVDQYNQIIGSQDQTLNLEINFRYIIKVLYSLFGLDGLTIFFEDIQFCSPKEWGMISEAFEFFNANKIQDSVSIKIVASFGSQGSDEEKEKLFGYLSQANIVLHSVTLQKIDRESFKNFVEATLMVNKIKSNFSLTGDTLAVLRSPVSAADSTISKYVTGSPSLLASYAFSTLSTSSTSIFPVSINHDQNQDPRIEALSNFLYEKTNASAFHTFGFFIMLYLLGLITYKENGRGKGWNVIYNKYLFDRNEAFYGSDFFDTLSEEDLTILKYAAISRKGYHFYLLELITVSGFPMKRVVELLNMCLNCRLISAGNTIYKFPFHLIDSETQSIGNDNEKGSFFGVSSDKIKEIASQTRYRFSHDSLIQCLHSLMKSKGEFELYHKRCGMRIYNSNLKTFPKLTISQYLTMANHFVHSWKIATLPDERKIYFEVLIQAGRYASLTQKTDQSLVMFETADKFIDVKNHKKKLKNVLTICQIHFYLKNYENCLTLISETEKCYSGKNVDTLAMFLIPRVRCLIMMEKYKEGVEVAIAGLKKVNEVEVSLDPVENSKIAARVSLKIPLSVLDIRKLGTKQRTENPKILLIYELITEILGPTYILNQDSLRNSLAAQTVLLMHEYGVSLHCAIPLLEYANIFISHVDESSYLKALEFSKLALKLVDSDSTVSFSQVQRVYETYITNVAALMEPVANVLKYFEVYITNYERQFVKTTTSVYEGLQVASKLQLLYFTGHSVNDIIKYGMESLLLPKDSYRTSSSAIQLEGFRLLHEDITYEQFLEQFDDVETSSNRFKFCYYMMQIFWLLIAGKFEEAGEVIYKKIWKLVDEVPFMLLHLHYYFYSSLVLQESPSTIPKEFRDLHWKKTYNFFSLWTLSCPANFKTKFLLIQAIIKQQQKEEGAEIEVLDILDLYEEAIEVAKINQNWHDVAWGNLLCGSWLIRFGKNEKRAAPLINYAYSLFQKSHDFVIITRIKFKYSKYLDSFDWAGTPSNNKALPIPQSGRHPIMEYAAPHMQINYNHSPKSGPGQTLSNTKKLRNHISLPLSVIGTSGTGNGSAIFRSKTGDRDAFVTLQKAVSPTSVPLLPLAGSHNSMPANEFRTVSLNSLYNKRPLSPLLHPQSKLPTPVQSHFNMNQVDSTNHSSDVDASELNRAVNACLSISESSNENEIVQKLLESTILFSTADYGVVALVLDNEPLIQAIGTSTSIFQIDNEPLSSRADLCPVTLINHCIQTSEIISKDQDYIMFETRYGKDDYYHDNPVFSVICIPLRNRSGIFGALYLEIQNAVKSDNLDDGLLYLPLSFIKADKRDLLDLLCAQAAVSLEKSRLYGQMQDAKMAAEDATAEKASFLANMSHEIRTPFNSLLSCSIFLLDTDLTLTQKEYVETIKLSAMVTLNIIDGILAFSKIEHGSFLLENANFSLNECIESALQLVGEQAASNDLELVFFNKCQQIESIIGDVTRFRQIVINLVGNAVKFTREGYISVETTATEITKDRYEIVVSVTDTGIGISKESHNKVFGAFSQVDGSSQRIYGGAGLGLAISKKLANIMGGSLTFDSIEGNGLTFMFNVSTKVVVSLKPEIYFQASDCTGIFGNRALIIDSHKLSSSSLAETLKTFGLEVDISNTPMSIKQNLNSNYLVILIHSNLFAEFRKLNDLSQIRSKLVIVSQYGKPLPKEMHEEIHVNSMLLVPFQRMKIINILKEIKMKLELGVASLNGSECIQDKAVRSSSIGDATSTLAEKYPLRILVAEDNLINVKVALQHLKKFGYKADHAKDGVKVLEMCNKKLKEEKMKYDVILMDIQMPKKDGLTAAIELQAQFKEEGKEEYLPVIVALTANVAGEDRQKCLACGMVDFIPKPILPNELKRVLIRVGEGEFDLNLP